MYYNIVGRKYLHCYFSCLFFEHYPYDVLIVRIRNEFCFLEKTSFAGFAVVFSPRTFVNSPNRRTCATAMTAKCFQKRVLLPPVSEIGMHSP